VDEIIIKGDIKMADITSLAVQKTSKPNIEDVLPFYVEDETLKTALNFVAYLRENKMKPVWTIHNAWKCTYKGKVLYYIRLPLYQSHFTNKRPDDKTEWKKSWTFTPYLHNINEYEDNIDDKDMQERILACLWYANPNCGNKQNRGCACTYHKLLFGKQIHLCYGNSYGGCATWFTNPNEAEIEWIKKLLEWEKQAIADNAKK